MPFCRLWSFALCALGTYSGLVAAQMQFEIPAEMLQGLMGGGMMGGGQRRKPTEWPKSENSEIAPEFEWLVNTEWQGKTAKYLLLRDGDVESDLKECEHEGQCLWAANKDRVLINTPSLKVIKFTFAGMDKVDRKKLEEKDEKELNKVTLIAEKPGKSGKRSELKFSKVATADGEEAVIARDLYEILDVPEDAEQSAIKSKFRRLSVQNHPDKGGDPAKFAEIREAYEILGDQDNRRYYALGGIQLVKNVELGYKEAESQKAQLDAQLNGVPKNHPQYQQLKQQVEAKKRQFDRKNMKGEIEQKFQNEELEVPVPISAEELYNGVSAKTFDFKRLVICRGCRADPNAEKCKDCGRCPPEKIQVPKYAKTPFGRQVVGMREKEQESRERCREVVVKISNLRVPKGAKAGSTLKYVSEVGHQTPGKLPGKIVLKVQHGSPEDLYTIAESDLHTVLSLSLEQALFGFSVSWVHLGDQKVTVARKRAKPDEVVILKKKGLVGDGGVRGDLYVRLSIQMPDSAAGQSSLTLQAPTASEQEAKLSREDTVEIREGVAWRLWKARETPVAAKAGKDGKKEEL